MQPPIVLNIQLVSKRVRAVVLLVVRQVYGSAGASTIVAFLKLIAADCGY
jgi:hypothetical protein